MPETDSQIKSAQPDQTPLPDPIAARRLRIRAQWERTVVDAPALLEPRISQMERGRTWFEKPEDGPGRNVKSFLREFSEPIEQTLATGKTVLEIGAGKLEASRELANAFPTGNIIAVEPFPDENFSKDLPNNLVMIPKKIEEVTQNDVSGKKIDFCFSVWVFDYAVDKLKFLKSVYDLLEDDGAAVILSGESTISDPPLATIFEEAGAGQIYFEEKGETGTKLIVLRKKNNMKLDFSQFQLVAAPHAGGGMIISHYKQKPKVE